MKLAVKFLLDTDTCIYALKQNQSVLGQLLSKSREDILVSVISESSEQARPKALRRSRRFGSSRIFFDR